MIEVKDVMWAVWCVIAAVGAYKVGHFLGFKTGLEVAKGIIGKLVMEGKIDVPKPIQKPIHETQQS